MGGALTIQGVQTGIPEGSKTVSLTVTMGTVGTVTDVVLASGANTVTVPTGAAGCLIIPPSANTVALTLKGVGADTGVAISPSAPCLLTFPATPPANFVINAASATSGSTEISFF